MIKYAAEVHLRPIDELVKIAKGECFSFLARENAVREILNMIQLKHLDAYRYCILAYPLLISKEKCIEILEAGVERGDVDCEYELFKLNKFGDKSPQISKYEFSELKSFVQRGQRDARYLFGMKRLVEAKSYQDKVKGIKMMCEVWDISIETFWDIMHMYMDTDNENEIQNHNIIAQYAPKELKKILDVLYTFDGYANPNEYKLLMDVHNIYGIPYNRRKDIENFLLNAKYAPMYDRYMIDFAEDRADKQVSDDFIETGNEKGSLECEAIKTFKHLSNTTDVEDIKADIQMLDSISDESVYACKYLAEIYSDESYGRQCLDLAFYYAKRALKFGYVTFEEELNDILWDKLYNKYGFQKVYEQKEQLFDLNRLKSYEYCD